VWARKEPAWWRNEQIWMIAIWMIPKIFVHPKLFDCFLIYSSFKRAQLHDSCTKINCLSLFLGGLKHSRVKYVFWLSVQNQVWGRFLWSRGWTQPWIPNQW
jgi:hypothetical protein